MSGTHTHIIKKNNVKNVVFGPRQLFDPCQIFFESIPPTPPTPKFHEPTSPMSPLPKFDPRHPRTRATHTTHATHTI